MIWRRYIGRTGHAALQEGGEKHHFQGLTGRKQILERFLFSRYSRAQENILQASAAFTKAAAKDEIHSLDAKYGFLDDF